jgi:glycosyltransferase involved in cell wall biosynthesis
MSLLRRIPVKYRLPIIHSALWSLAAFKSRHWPKAKASDVIKPGPLMVSGFFSESSGIAQGAKDIVAAFDAINQPVISHDVRTSFAGFIKGRAQFPTAETGGVWLLPINPAETVIAFMAHDVETWRHRYRIGYWAWETTLAPQTWVWVAQYLHEIWVPSLFVRDALIAAFIRAGKPELSDRLRIMLHPMRDFSSVTPDRQAFGLSPDLCEVLCLFDMNSAHSRKNPWAVIEAWTLAFPQSSPQARLRLKVQNLDNDPATRRRFEQLLATRDDITLFDKRLSDEHMRRFMASFNVLISLHRSEGFGLTLAEAMAMNVGVIATGWSGNMAFMTEANSYLIPCHLTAIEDPAGMYGGLMGRRDNKQQWAEPDVEAAAKALKEAVTVPEKRALKIAVAKATLHQNMNAPWSREALSALPGWKYIT